MTTRNGFSRTIIPFPEGEYMRRWIFQCRWFTVRLHKTQLPDEYRPHNHPWSFISVILKGRYDEMVYGNVGTITQTQRLIHRQRWRPVFRHKDTFHRVMPVGGPSWSLVLTGPKRTVKFGTEKGDASWGFLNDDGTVSHWRSDDTNQENIQRFGTPTPEV